jgi:glycosyltransferase involved in cell wall biosynthesis
MATKVLIISSITETAPYKPDIELVKGLHNCGIQVDVMIPSGSPYVKIFGDLGIRVIPAHPVRKFSPESVRLIRNEITKQHYDIIHLFNTKAIVNGSLAAVGKSVKVIAYRGAAGLYWYDPTAWWSHLNPRINYLVCNSNYVLQHVKRQLFPGSTKAVMIYKGMDPEWFSNTLPVSRETLGIPDNALIAGCVANVRKVKGVPYLLKATYLMDPKLPLHIVLIGQGMESAGIRRLIDASPFRDRIHTLGYRKDVYEVVAACDLYIQPSLSESLSRSVMEAMCLKVPCVVSNVGGLAELVAHEKSGLTVKKANPAALADAITRLAENQQLRQDYAAEAFNRMQRIFSVDHMIANTKKLYEDIVS